MIGKRVTELVTKFADPNNFDVEHARMSLLCVFEHVL